jgi:hypothetical protein
MRKQFVILLALAALILTGIFIVAPKATVYQADAVGIDITGLTKGAKNLPGESYPAH